MAALRQLAPVLAAVIVVGQAPVASLTYSYDGPVGVVAVAPLANTSTTSPANTRTDAARGERNPQGARPSSTYSISRSNAAKSETALVKYDPEFASRQLLGQHGVQGYARTPGGRTVSAHAAERIALGGPGRPPTTLEKVDEIIENATQVRYQLDRGTIRVARARTRVRVSSASRTERRLARSSGVELGQCGEAFGEAVVVDVQRPAGLVVEDEVVEAYVEGLGPARRCDIAR